MGIEISQELFNKLKTPTSFDFGQDLIVIYQVVGYLLNYIQIIKVYKISLRSDSDKGFLRNSVVSLKFMTFRLRHALIFLR